MSVYFLPNFDTKMTLWVSIIGHYTTISWENFKALVDLLLKFELNISSLQAYKTVFLNVYDQSAFLLESSKAVDVKDYQKLI